MSARLLLVPLAVEAALAVVVVVLLIAVAIHQSVRERRDRQLASLRRVLAETATDPTTASTAARLGAVPAVAALPTLLSLSTSMSGVTMERVRDLADLAGITEQARAWSVSRLWWRRVRGIRVLTRLGDDSLQLTAMLDDPAPAVRAAAADAVGQRASPAEVARLLGLLDDPDPACRFSARTGLLAAGPVAADAIESYLGDGAAPRLAIALDTATAMAGPRFLAAALRLSTHPDHETRLAAARLVAGIGGAASASALVGLLADSAPDIRAEAASGLGRLGQWQQAPPDAALLSDPSWDVRRAAALALRGLGAPGRLYLRRARTGGDAFAADMARSRGAISRTPSERTWSSSSGCVDMPPSAAARGPSSSSQTRSPGPRCPRRFGCWAGSEIAGSAVWPT